MDVKVSKDKYISRWIDWENLINVRWNRNKNSIMTKKVINRGKRSKTLSEVKLFENISKNPQSLLEISPVQKEILFHINCKAMHMSNRIFSD